MGLSGHLPSDHLRLCGLVADRDSDSLPRVVRVLHAGRLVTGFEGGLGDDPRRPVLRDLRGSPCGGSGRPDWDLVVPVGATIVSTTPGNFERIL